MSFRIHHLSDVHFGSSSYKPTNRSRIIPERTERNAKAYQAHLSKLGDDSFPDLVVISGDFATFAEEDEMDAAADFVTRILKTMVSKGKGPASAPKVMIVPGNHDVDWRKSTSEESHNRFTRFANTVYSSGAVLASKYHQEPDRPVCFDFGNDAGIFVYLLNSTSYGGAKHPILASIYEAIRGKASQISGLTEEACEAFGIPKCGVTRDLFSSRSWRRCALPCPRYRLTAPKSPLYTTTRITCHQMTSTLMTRSSTLAR